MMTEVLQPTDRILKAIEIAGHIDIKQHYFRKKYERAKRNDHRQQYWEKYKVYSAFSHRAFLLIMNLRSPRPFGVPRYQWLLETPQQYLKRESERVVKGKQIFQEKHKYSPWFFRTEFSNDYGTHVCDCCGVTFYHSPSKITKALTVVYNSACGNCTNDIISRDWNETPYK